jgi:hypothetical protein
LEPVKRAIGQWNWQEENPMTILESRFNGYLKAVILRINEALDLGDFDRRRFYDHLKAIIASPSDVLRINEKHIREYYIPNLCGVVITTNHKTDGIYLPKDDAVILSPGRHASAATLPTLIGRSFGITTIKKATPPRSQPISPNSI